jgi:hypothetical protein
MSITQLTTTGAVGIGVTSPVNPLSVSGNAVVSGNLTVPTSNFFYIGDSATNGSWRIGLSGLNFVIERLESAVWVIKYYVTP